MKSSNFRVLLCSAVLVTAFWTGGVDAGSQYVNCPGNFTEIGTFIPCEYDCITNHAASGGVCVTDSSGNTNCICTESGLHPYSGSCTYINNNIQIPAICQCATNLVPGISDLYAGVCLNDCQCDHGAAGGTCDWDGRACICDYSFPNGGSWSPSNCDAQAFADAGQALADALNLLG